MDDDKADDIKIRDYLALLNECVKGFADTFILLMIANLSYMTLPHFPSLPTYFPIRNSIFSLTACKIGETKIGAERQKFLTSTGVG